MDYQQIVLLAFLVLLSIPQIVSIVMLMQRREHQPIKYRGVWLLLISGTAIFIAWSYYLLFLVYQLGNSADDAQKSGPSGLRTYFCGDWQWLLWICNGTIMCSYFLRSYRILKIFHDHTSNWVSPLSLQQQLNADSVSHTTQSNTAGISLGNPLLSGSNLGMSVTTHSRKLDRRIYTEKYMIQLLVAFLVVLVVIKVALDQTGHRLIYNGFGCGEQAIWGWLATDLFEIACLLVAIWKLRTIRDDYGIATELQTVCVIWIVCSAALGLSVFLRRSSNMHWIGGSTMGLDSYLEFESGVWAVRNFAIFFTSITWPLIQSFYNSFPPLWSNCDALCSLETLLKDIVCIQYFRNYLMSINRVEYILAWVEMELFKDLDEEDPDLMGVHARRIYEKYIQLGSELEVHLSPSIVHLVTRDVHVGVPQITCFEEAQRELLQFMEAEFARFLSSPSCEACLRELEKEEQLREVLERSGMI